MKKHKQQMLPLDPDVDALLERIKGESKVPKRHIGNAFIRTEARRRGMVVEDVKPEGGTNA